MEMGLPKGILIGKRHGGTNLEVEIHAVLTVFIGNRRNTINKYTLMMTALLYHNKIIAINTLTN